MTGARYERELVNRLNEAGYAALRAPSSGSATDRDLPDVLAGRQPEERVDGTPLMAINGLSDALAIEAKSGQDTTLYVAPEEVAALERFADRFGARPLLAARFTTRRSSTAWFLLPPTAARRTESGQYGLPVADAEERAEVMLYTEGEA
jgi:Holliday junction resolvase